VSPNASYIPEWTSQAEEWWEAALGRAGTVALAAPTHNMVEGEGQKKVSSWASAAEASSWASEEAREERPYPEAG
jgi:hypothetical protein